MIFNLIIPFSFKVWRMTGELIYEYKTNENQELWQVLWQPGSYPRGERAPLAPSDGAQAGKRKILISFAYENRSFSWHPIAKAAAAYRPPHLRNTTRQVPKLHEDGEKMRRIGFNIAFFSPVVPVKPASQSAAPRVPKPGGVEELFTGDLEKDKKIKQIHKVTLRCTMHVVFN